MCDNRFSEKSVNDSKNQNYKDITKELVKGLKNSDRHYPLSISFVNNKKGNASFELEKLLMKGKIRDALLFKLLPGFVILKECSQKHPAHRYNVLTHTKKVVLGIPDDIEGEIAGMPKSLFLKYVALFHDVGKPDKKYEDEKGIERFHGHEEKSAEIAEELFKHLGFGQEVIDPAIRLIKVHDMKIEPTVEGVDRAVEIAGKDIFELLLIHQEADLLAHRKWYAKERIHIIRRVKEIYETEFKYLI